MFSTSDIVANTNSKSFQRGSLIAEKEGSVVARRFTEGKRTNDVSACVKSQSGIAERFDSSLVLDADCSRIVDYSCDCPAVRKFGVMCKHCVALASTFRRDPESFAGYVESHVPRSSTSILGFMDEAPAMTGTRVMPGSVHLALELAQGFGAWTAQFSVTASGMTYVMADIAAFTQALAGERFLSYGKMLAFVHTYDALDEPSRRLALVMGDIIDHQGSARPTKRTLQLTEQDVVRLIDAVGDESFSFANQETDADAQVMHAVDANPDLALRIIRASDEYYEIVRDEDIKVALGCDHAVVILDGVAYRCSRSFAHAAAFLSSVYLSPDDELLIATEDLARFCRYALPVLEDAMELHVPAELEALRPTAARFSFYLDCVGKGKDTAITMDLSASYKGRTHALLSSARADETPHGQRVQQLAAAGDGVSAGAAVEEGAPDASAHSVDAQTYRDEAAEQAAVDLAFKYFDATMRIPLDDVDAAGLLLYEGIAEMQAAGDVFTTPDFDRLINDKRMRVQIGLSISGNLINLDVQPTDVSKDELARVLASYQKHRRFHKLKSGAIMSLESVDVAELDRMMQDLGITSADLCKDTIELPTYSAFYLDREYAEAMRDESFDEYVYRFDNDAGETAVPPDSIAATLRPYQLEGFRWLSKLAGMGFGGILADEMGLGKSIQMIAFLLSLKEREDAAAPALVVCPASLVYNWTAEFAKFAPTLSVSAIDGPADERAQKRRTPATDVFVASYDAVRQDSEAFQAMTFSTVALDEAQFIKNHATKTARAVKRLHGQHRFALTGTPIENRLSEIWSIMDFLMPGFLGSYALFRKRYEIDILGGDNRAAERLQALVGPFVLRRMKADVLTELPEKQEIVVHVALEGEQKRLYDAQEQNLRIELLAQRKAARARARKRTNASLEAQGLRVDVLTELMRLRQVALEPSLVYADYRKGSAKTAAILELVDQARESGRKTLIFSQFTSYLDVLKAELDAAGVPYYEITGRTAKRERIELASAFNADDVPVFLVSLKAGGTGLNLTGASIVIHADPWWNAAATDQATDRAHRIGQEDLVSVYKVIAQGTIEERILELQEKKSRLADSVVSETSLASLSSLTRTELEDLLLND